MNEDNSLLKNLKEKLIKHLSDEFIELSEKKDDLTIRLENLEQELNNQSRTLFSGIEKGNIKKLFSPLTITEEHDDTTNEKTKVLNSQISNLKEEIDIVDRKLNEIKSLIEDTETCL